jgi:FdhD protein
VLKPSQAGDSSRNTDESRRPSKEKVILSDSVSLASPHTSGDSTSQASVEKVTGQASLHLLDQLAVEEPLEIQITYGPRDARQTKSISITMRTPGNDFDLAAGFLMTEGVVQNTSDIEQISFATHSIGGSAQFPLVGDAIKPDSKQNIVRVGLAAHVNVPLASLQRNFYATSSCGICGKASLLALRTVFPPRSTNNFRINAKMLYSLPDRLRSSQGVFDRTGGLHGAGLFDTTGNLLALREDVGRHNAVDKLIGSEFLAGRTPLRDRVLLLSGRASFELLQKALMGGIQMVAAVGAPSSLAVDVAKEFDITLVGFLRDDHFNIYHGSERIDGYTPTAAGAGE